MMVIFEKVINDCSECPFMKSERHYTADSFEMVFDWVCIKSHGAIIATLDWNDPNPSIPEWCQLRTMKEQP